MSPSTAARLVRPASWRVLLPWLAIAASVLVVWLAWTPPQSFMFAYLVNGVDPSNDPMERGNRELQAALIITFVVMAVAMLVLVQRTPMVGTPRPVGRRRVLDLVAVGAAFVAMEEVLVHAVGVLYRPDTMQQVLASMRAGAAVLCLTLLLLLLFFEVAYRLTRTVAHPQRHHARVLGMVFLLPLLGLAEYGLQSWALSRVTGSDSGLPWYVDMPHLLELAVVAAVLVAASWVSVALARRDQG